MVSVAIILVSLLFLVSLLNIIFLNYPTFSKKVRGWFRCLVDGSISTEVLTTSTARNLAPNGKEIEATNTTIGGHHRVVEKKIESGGGKGGFDERRKMLFNTFDRNGDGFITRQELKDSLRGMRISTSEEEVDEIVARSDGNGDGLIDFEEFCELLEDSGGVGFGSGGGSGQDDGGLREAFDVFDRDKDGLISVDELGSVMSSLGLVSDRGDCKAMIRKVDMDGDGMVNFDEFKRMMMPEAAAGGYPELVATN